MKNKYYHVTCVKNLESIVEDGIRVNEYGQIFLFDKKKFAGYIASGQCGLRTYALFVITGIEEQRLEPDNVAEFTAKSQWIYDQNIPPHCLDLISFYDVSYKSNQLSHSCVS